MPLGQADSWEILLKTKADTKGVKDTEDSLKSLNTQTEKGGLSFLKLSSAVAVGEAAFRAANSAVHAAVGFLGDSVKAYNEAESSSVQLEHAVIGVSHATKEQLAQTNALADSLEKKGVLDGDDIKLGLAQLSTFGLSNKAVQALGGSLADLAVNQFGVHASGEQLSDTANMIAKALNGQFGILEKSGIRFTDAQKHMIEFGSEMEKVKAINEGFAQNLKLTNEVALTTTDGKLAKLKVSFENIKESIGKATVEALTPFIGKAADFISAIDWDKVIQKSVDALKVLWGWLKKVGDGMIDVYKQIADYLGPKLKDLWHRIQDDLIPVLSRLWREVIEPLVPVIGTVFVGAVGLLVDTFKFLLDIITPVMNFLLDHKQVVLDFAIAFGILAAAMAVGPAIDAMTVAFTTFQLVTIPSLMTSLGLLGSAFIAALPVIAIGVAIAEISSHFLDMKKVVDQTNDSIKALDTSTDAAMKKIQEAVKNGTISPAKGAQTIKLLSEDNSGSTNKSWYNYLPGFASGTKSAPGGLALVGEEGPEVVNLPRGASVSTTKESKQMMGGASITIQNLILPGVTDRGSFIKAMDQDALLTSKGLAPTGGY